MNIKKLLLSTFLCSACMSAMAVPARRILRTYTQSDGEQISVMLVGDEHFHTYVTSDGLTLARNAKGDFVYQTSSGLSSVMAHNPNKRPVAELQFLEAEKGKLSMSALAIASKANIERRKGVAAVATRAGETQVPNNGSPRIPVLLVEYRDKKFKDADPKATFEDFFHGSDASAFAYFKDQSNGKFTPQFDVYGPYTLPNNRSYYGQNDSWGDDRRPGEMVAVAAQGLDKDIDYRNYDNDGDGVCDVLIVLYAGDGEASSYDSDAENSIWPHQWDLGSSDYGKDLTLDGITLSKYAVFNELNGSNLRKIDGIGTFCHEFSHCLGLPDFYDTQYNYFGMGPWSLMDSGSYNNDGYTPIGYSAYEKEFMGWMDIEEAKENTRYILDPLNLSSGNKDRAIRITNDKDNDEYFILENRKRQGWDEYMEADGLMIYHVTYSQNAWNQNVVNNYSMQRMTPVPADNSLKMDKNGRIDEADLKGDLWPFNGNKDFTDSSSPNQKVNTGGLLGKPVTDITKNEDGTISFWVMRGAAPRLDVPLASHEIVSPSSVTIRWEHPMADDATFSLEVKEYKEDVAQLVRSTVFDNNNHGWEVDGYGAIEEDGGVAAIRLGSSKQAGIITSPVFTTNEEGAVTIILNSKYYNKDMSEATVSLVNKNFETLDEAKVSLTSQFEDYSVVLSGEGNKDAMVVIECKSKKRIWVSKVDIYNGLLEETATRAASYSKMVEGIEGTSYTLDDLTPNTVYTYRVMAVPRDEDKYQASDWSDKIKLDLSDIPSGLTDLDLAEDMEAEYFTLQGLKIGRPSAPGIYIVKKGSKSSKMNLR